MQNKYSKLHLTINKKRNSFFIKDPIHQEINFSKDQLWIYELINTPEFQRLTRIQQLGLTKFNFPCATHTRYSHSLGTYELANRFIQHFWKNGELNEENQIEINIALVAALLHDLGHGPYSHTFESAFNFFHEEMTVKIIKFEEGKINYLLRKKAKSDGLDECFYIDEICKVLNKTSDFNWIQTFISSEIDVDRLDYIARDKFFSGSNNSALDYNLLIKWSTLVGKGKDKKFLFLSKAKYLIFNFLISRQYMYLEIYTNQISTIYEKLLWFIVSLCLKMKETIKKNSCCSNFCFLFNDEKEWTISNFLFLHDENFNYFLDKLAQEKYPLLSSIVNLYLGNLDNSEHDLIKLNELEYKKYSDFCKLNPITKENQVLFEQINKKESNLNNEILFFNDVLNSEELIKLSLSQEKKDLIYIAIISKERYLEWIKYLHNE